MNEDKMSSSEVPGKFADWLLAMGCPPEKIPSMDKVAQMCRGQYYMAWRSLMEHVECKDLIRQKRLQVFYDDVRRCQQAHSHDGGVLVPQEVSAWRQRRAARAQLTDAEARVADARERLSALMDKVSGKLAQRELARCGVNEASRRAWLLRTLSEALRARRGNLLESRRIAEALCRRPGEATGVKTKLDRCVAALIRQTVSPTSAVPNPIASSSLVSTSGETIEQSEYLAAVAECPAHSLWQELRARRAALVDALAAADVSRHADTTVTPQCIVARTAALHSQLALESLKHKLQIKQTQQRLADALNGLSDMLTSESCELLVLRCEQARAEARVATLKKLLEDVTSRRGAFAPGEGEPKLDGRGTTMKAVQLHRALLAKKEDIRKLLMHLTKTERKIQSVRDSLTMIFSGFQKDLDECGPPRDGTPLLVDLPTDSVTSVRQLYRGRLNRRAEQSLQLDASAGSLDDDAENLAEPSFIDELRFYLKKFCLEKNRKLVLESGEKIWMFETLQASVGRLHARCLADDVTCALVCPSLGLTESLRRLCDVTDHRSYLESLSQALDAAERGTRRVIDITPMKAEEDQQTDKIKKRLNKNMLSLQKTSKTLDLGRENLSLWSQNLLRRHISDRRTVAGKTYREYEGLYLLECVNPAV